MRQVAVLELPLWEVLEVAAIAPEEADLARLLQVLDSTLLQLDTPGQLQVAAEAIAQIAQLVNERSLLAVEELQAEISDDGPIMPVDAFDRYVRQSMEVDFEQFIESLPSLPRQQRQDSFQGFPDDGRSIVAAVDKQQLLQVLVEQEKSDLSWEELKEQVLEIAHGEDVGSWVRAISSFLQIHAINSLSLVELQQALGMDLVEVWLGLLHAQDCCQLQQRGDFYEQRSIQILRFE